jgi:predicted phosphodiesterase
MDKRTIVIGDVHGCLAELDELLKVVEYKADDDRLVFVGDLVDRGPDSVGVVRRVRELNAEVVMGNHDEKHLRWKRWEDKVASGAERKNPMKAFDEDKLSTQAGLNDEDFAWIARMPKSLRLGNLCGREYAVVHGGCEANRPFNKQGKQVLRVRYCNVETGCFNGSDYPGHQPAGTRYWSELWKGPESIIYGHAVWDEVRTDHYDGYACWGIDTGCVFGGSLTALLLHPGVPHLTTAKVDAKEVYSVSPVELAKANG